MITFIDHIGRVVIGKLVTESENSITVNYPVILHTQIDPQTQKLNVQTYPYFFTEFIDQRDASKNNWIFNRNNIVQSEVSVEVRILEQYERMANPQQVSQEEPEVIKLFDEK
jgi:hypothetical protein